MDEVDRAQKITDQALEIALDHQKTKAACQRQANATGVMNNSDWFFCDQDCRDDFEKQQRFRAVR